MQVCLKLESSANMWYLDSGCSRHMTGDKDKFVDIKPKGGNVTFGDNNKASIIGIGKIGKENSPTIDNVLLVKGLKYNLLSISHLCDKNNRVIFEHSSCIVQRIKDGKVLFIGHRQDNVYVINMDNSDAFYEKCFSVFSENTFIWHRRLGHASMDLISKLQKQDLVKGLPKLSFEKEGMCDACVKGKHVRSSFKSKNIVSSSRPLELLHLDLFGPSRISSLGGKKYALVVVDDFTRFCWTVFLAKKNQTCSEFIKLARRVQNEKSLSISSIRSDHGGEFKNEEFEKFCESSGILHTFSAPRTPQQNGVVERKNRSLEEMARTLLNEANLPGFFWAEAVSTASYILNRTSIRPILKKTPYELWKGRKPNIHYFHIFGCKCFILNNGKDNLGKFDSKSDEGIFLGYSTTSKAYRVYNKRTLSVEESIHIIFDESNSLSSKDIVDEDAGASETSNTIENDEMESAQKELEALKEEEKSEQNSRFPTESRINQNHPIKQIIGDISHGVKTRSSLRDEINNTAFISHIEPKKIDEALSDEGWINAIQEELQQFERNEVWTLVHRLKYKAVIGIK